ncbi:MAG: L-rhamnose isomerase, partial [Tyzzerella sp.]|nr:L-rhamnose isomerase [Tyzzerella sp.]
WVVGFRSWQKALLNAMLLPNEMLRELQETNQMSKLMVMQEELKSMPFGDVWAKYCEVCGVEADESWFDEVMKYEKEVLLKR